MGTFFFCQSYYFIACCITLNLICHIELISAFNLEFIQTGSWLLYLLKMMNVNSILSSFLIHLTKIWVYLCLSLLHTVSWHKSSHLIFCFFFLFFPLSFLFLFFFIFRIFLVPFSFSHTHIKAFDLILSLDFSLETLRFSHLNKCNVSLVAICVVI